jgi:alpha-glucoside transport system permease protein
MPTRPPRQKSVSTERSPKDTLQGFAFIAPAIFLLGSLILYPMVQTIRVSFSNAPGLVYDGWIGLSNYRELLTQDPDFLDRSSFPPTGALVNNIRWVVVYITISLVLGLALAILTTRVRYERLVKAIIFVPMAISATAVALIWLFVYSSDPSIGVLNAVLHGWLGFHPVSWLGKESTVNYAIIMGYIWASVGFVMVVLSAAIKGIPQEIIEAARTDGANEWSIFRRVQLPMLSLPISVVTVWLFINVIKVFDIVYVMTQGGPGTSSRVIAYTMFVEMFNGHGGYGSAVAVFMLILMIPFMILNIRRFRSEALT